MEPFIAAAGSLAAGGLNYSGISRQNLANERIADKQMQFQERMSNTAYQRARHDLESAGYNPILALGSPASTPGGAGHAQQNEFSGYGVDKVVSSALEARRANAEIRKLNLDSSLTQAMVNNANIDSSIKSNQAQSIALQNDLLSLEKPKAEFDAWLDNSWFGKTMNVINRVSEPIQNVLSGIKGFTSAKNANALFRGLSGHDQTGFDHSARSRDLNFDSLRNR